MKCTTDSIKGKKRKKNKDRTLVIDSHNFSLFALFDGVSSAKGAIEGVQESIWFLKKNHLSYLKDSLPELDRLLLDLNIKLVSSNLDEPFTTCSLLLIPQDPSKPLQFLNIGDSRIYSVTRQYLKLHTNKGQSDVFKNQLLDYLGKPDLDPKNLKVDTIQRASEDFIICSDGFYQLMESHKQQFFKIFQFSYLKNLQKAIRKEISKKNTDDATYIFVKASDV